MAGKHVKPITVEQPALVHSLTPAGKCWRLVINPMKKEVVLLLEASGEMKIESPMNLFVSDFTDGSTGGVSSAEGLQQCIDVVKDNGYILSLLPDALRQKIAQDEQNKKIQAQQQAFQRRQEALKPQEVPKLKPLVRKSRAVPKSKVI